MYYSYDKGINPIRPLTTKTQDTKVGERGELLGGDPLSSVGFLLSGAFLGCLTENCQKHLNYFKCDVSLRSTPPNWHPYVDTNSIHCELGGGQDGGALLLATVYGKCVRQCIQS